MTLSARAFVTARGIPIGGLRDRMGAAGTTSLRTWLQNDLAAADFPWTGGWLTPLMVNGDLGAKITIAVLADGFASQDQRAFDMAVDNLLITGGVFANDFYLANRQAFNVLKINLVSNDSGVSTKTYMGNTVTAQTDRDTALGVYYSGDWNHCWLEDGAITADRLKKALSMWVPDYSLVLVLLNNPGSGGCGGNGRATVGLGVGWATVAHELGHAFGGLADEYCKPASGTGTGSYPPEGAGPTEPNLTTNTDRLTLKWRDLLAADTPVPTGTGSCATYTAGAKPAAWNDNRDVGVFEGGGGFDTGIYRPALDCRMRTDATPFCPVCERTMVAVTWPHLAPQLPPGAAPGHGGEMPRSTGGYLRMVMRVDGDTLRLLDAREVEGDLVQPDRLTHGLVHEVRVEDRRVAIEAVRDAGAVRSFSERGADGPSEHHLRREEAFDFVVRVPRSVLVGVDPASVSMALLELRADRPVVLTDDLDQPLGARAEASGQAAPRPAQVASLSGLTYDAMPSALQRALAGPA